MTKEVLVSIAGLQYENEGDEAIEMISIGEYYFRNQKHYVIYDELLEGSENVTSTVKCTIKMTDKQIEVIKKGPAAVHMIFELGQNHMTYYATPYGDLMIGITTKAICLQESDDLIEAKLTYAIDMNYQFVSDRNLTIKITKKKQEI
jgi:uncharacterized beta-barrel protein YwiB (DUF1934 family)